MLRMQLDKATNALWGAEVIVPDTWEATDDARFGVVFLGLEDGTDG